MKNVPLQKKLLFALAPLLFLFLIVEFSVRAAGSIDCLPVEPQAGDWETMIGDQDLLWKLEGADVQTSMPAYDHFDGSLSFRVGTVLLVGDDQNRRFDRSQEASIHLRMACSWAVCSLGLKLDKAWPC